MKSIKAWALSFFYLGILAAHFLNFPLPEFAGRIISLLLAAFYAFGCYSVGRLISDRFPIFRQSDFGAWRYIFAFGFGVGFVGLAVFLTGWVSIGNLTFKLSALIFLLCLALILDGKKNASEYRAVMQDIQISGQRGSSSVFLLIGTVGCLLPLLASFSPITYYDSLVYHLTLPKLYLSHGQISSIPFNLYSHFPALMEMHFMMFLALAPEPETVVNLFLWILSMILSSAVFLWAKEWGGKKCGVMAWGLYWSAPVILFLSIGGYVDVPLAFFTFLAVRLFYQASVRHFKFAPFFVGLLAGFACSIKYTGGITAAVLIAAIPWTNLRKRFLTHAIQLAAGVSVIFSPWLVKNWLEIGNPVFPFLYTVFPGSVGWTEQSAAAYFQLLTQYGAQSHIVTDLLRLPFLLIGRPMQFGGGFDVLGDFGWTLILFTAPLAIGSLLHNKGRRFLLVYLIGHGLFWFATKPVLRFLVAAFPFLVVLSSMGLVPARIMKERFVPKLTLFCFVSALIVSNFFLYYFINHDLQLFRVAMGAESKEDHLARRLPFFETFSYLNKNALGKVYVLGEQRTYHLNNEYESSNLFAPSKIALWANQAQNPADLRKIIKNQGIEVITLHWPEIERLGGLEKFGFNKNGLSNMNVLINNDTRLIFHSRGIEVRELKA